MEGPRASSCLCAAPVLRPVQPTQRWPPARLAAAPTPAPTLCLHPPSQYYMFKMFTGKGKPGAGAPGAGGPGGPQLLSPQFPKGHPVDAHLFISEGPDWRAAAAGTPVWTTSDVPLAESGEVRQGVYVYRPSPVRAVLGAGCTWRGPGWLLCCCPWVSAASAACGAAALLLPPLCRSPARHHNPASPAPAPAFIFTPAGGAEQRQRVGARRLHAHRRLAQPCG